MLIFSQSNTYIFTFGITCVPQAYAWEHFQLFEQVNFLFFMQILSYQSARQDDVTVLYYFNSVILSLLNKCHLCPCCSSYPLWTRLYITSLRRKQFIFYHQTYKQDYFRNSFFVRSANLWNSFSSQLKTHVHQYLHLVPDSVKCMKNDCYLTALLSVLNFKITYMVPYWCIVFGRCI